ncbi:STAS domain-containing protein [Streptomyces yangpuensis]|uniref:STAS domain-containing protein n=1 Tax=Streptomyces TaxID=1883 RepID=UPI00131C2A55|nr:STAS domain-containing protein [Streptomyces sp. NRRL S-378]
MTDDDQRRVVHVGGEMDIDRAPMLRDALYAAITEPGGPAEIVVDLSGLSFCDSSGLGVLVHARQTAAEHGRHISLRDPQPQFRRLLEMSGADSLFPITGS